mmetsp:Transcript_29120/g.94977  ORF Transcript_29120/g.94977 Transcript_29120/m.94977 type:complete len:98 (+) Transcript_29120:758-1051(+)
MRFQRPWMTAFSDSDPITAGGEAVFKKLVPGAAKGQHVVVRGGGHFLQEDCPDQVAGAIHLLIRSTPSAPHIPALSDVPAISDAEAKKEVSRLAAKL